MVRDVQPGKRVRVAWAEPVGVLGPLDALGSTPLAASRRTTAACSAGGAALTAAGV